MSVSAATLRKLATLHLEPDQMAGVLVLLADQQEAEEARLKSQRERKARQRAGQSRDSHETVTGQDCDQKPPDKEIPPTPPKEINPKNSPPLGVRNVPAKATPRSELEQVLSPEMAGAVIEHRQRIRKPMTDRAAKLLAGKFAQCPNPDAAADAMIANGWQGFEPGWLENRQRGQPPPRRDDRMTPSKYLGLLAQGIDPDAEPGSNQTTDHLRLVGPISAVR